MLAGGSGLLGVGAGWWHGPHLLGSGLGQSGAKVKLGQGHVFGAVLKTPELFTAHLTFLPSF